MKKILFAVLMLFSLSALAINPTLEFERTGPNTLRAKCQAPAGAQCDYNITGVAQFWSDNGVGYAYAIIKDEFGNNSRAAFHQLGGSYLAYGPYIEDAITNATIMAYGSVANYLIATLPDANAYIKIRTRPVCPIDPADKVAAAAYDLAMGVIKWNSTTKELEVVAIPPFPHVSCPQ